jgi:VanZ family protein
MRAVGRYAPPLAVMALIFALSATPDLSSGLGQWDLLLRKLAHITIYAVLWLTLARAAGWKRPIAATVVALLYACSDEYHQSLVQGRNGTPVDVAIDAFGIGLAACGWVLYVRRRGAGKRTPPARRRTPGSEPA